MTMTRPTSEQITFTGAGVGAQQRLLVDKVRETVSVKDFGAVGDDINDDTNAIQSAIDHAVAIGGAIVFLPAGIYRVTQTLTLPRLGCVTLAGVGHAEALAGSRIIWRGSDNSSVIKIDDYNNLSNLSIYSNGSYSNLTGVDARGTPATPISPTALIFTNVSVKSVTTGFDFNYGWYNAVYDCFALYCSYGIRMGVESNNFGFFNCHINNCSVAGIYWDGTGSRGNVFDACSIERNAIGVDCSAGLPTATTFRSCYFEDNTNYDIVVSGVQLVIDGCFFNGNSTATAIKFASANGAAVRNNVFLGGYSTSRVYEFPVSSSGFARHGIELGSESMSGTVAGSPTAQAIISAPWLISGSVLNMAESNVTFLTTPKLDASASTLDWLINPGQHDAINKFVAAAYLIAETDIVTNDTFRVRFGYSGATFNQMFDTTYTGTILSGTVLQLTLLQPARQVQPFPTNLWKLNSIAGTSGTYRLALVLCA